jgi:hypothetical protein
MALAFACDVLRQLARACSFAPDDAVFTMGVPTSQRRRQLAAGPSYNNSLGDLKRDVMRAVERVIELRVPRESALKNAEDLEALERILGLRLAASSRRDFRACVDFVERGAAAEAHGIQPGAVIIAVNEKSMRGVNAETVMEAIYNAMTAGGSDVKEVAIEFAQPNEEVPVDKNMYQLTSFPSPAGQHLPGVKQFQDFESPGEEVPVTNRAQQPPTQRRRERRSMKHFWMSDRSSKACYECEQLFTFMRRRHHCRSCGQIFCSQCCARLPQSFGGPKVDESISRLRKQLVCHTCHRQLREGLEVELGGAGNGVQLQQLVTADRMATPMHHNRPLPSPAAQTLMLMPPQIADALERSTSDAPRHYRNFDKTEFFNKDEISKDDGTSVTRGSEQAEKAARPSTLFNMFPKVQIVASVQQLTHQPRLQGISSARQESSKHHVRRRAYSLDLAALEGDGDHSRKDELNVARRRIKRANSLSEIGNPSNQQWDEKAEFKRIIEESKARPTRNEPSSPLPLMRTRPKAMSGTFTEPRFGSTVARDPFAVRRSLGGRIMAKALALGGVGDASDRNVLSAVGLSEDAINDAEDPVSINRRDEVFTRMCEHAQYRIEERIYNFFEASPVLSRLPFLEQHKWMKLIQIFGAKAANVVSCHPDEGDSMDVMEYARVKCLEGGRVQDSFFIDGVLVHKSLARKGMRCDIANPRILLIASDLDYQRRKEAIASLESVAGQEVEYMHIVAEKIMTMHPDIVMFSGHVHRVAEELLFKEGISVVKNVRLADLQRIARSTGASLLTSYDHVDKISDKSVIGTCNRFYVMVSNNEPKSARQFTGVQQDTNGNFHIKREGKAPLEGRKKRPQRQNIVFEGGITWKGCTVVFRGGSAAVFEEVSKALGIITRAAYNMRLQRAFLLECGYLPPKEEPSERSMAEEWFAKSSSSLYLSLKSNSLSMRASLKETQAMCKWCKDRTRYNNISSLRNIRTAEDEKCMEPYVPVSTAFGCSCSMRSSDALRERVLFSTCWSSLDGKIPSNAEMMCIDFYSPNDCSLGQFFERYCFASSDREFKRAFQTSKLSLSHDVGRITIRVRDLSEYKDPSEKGMPVAELLRDMSHRAVLRRIRSDRAHMWTRSLDAPTSSSRLASRFAPVPKDVWNFSFGKFVEGLLYGKSMPIDSARFPHLSRVSSSRDPSLVFYFSKASRVVSVQCEPLEPVLHVALQPVLWQDHVDQKQQLEAIQELNDLAREVYDTTTAKLAESAADPLTPLHAKTRLRILRNEVSQWYSCYGLKLQTDPPEGVFEKNARFKDIYKHAVDWSLRITQAMHATVKPTIKNLENSPKGTLPRAWFDQIAGAMEREFSNFSAFTPSATLTGLGMSLTGAALSYSASSTQNSGGLFDSSATHLSDEMPDGIGDLESLARFARSLTAGGESAVGTNSFSNISNEVTKTLNAHGKSESRGGSIIEMSDGMSNEDQNDQTSRSFPANESSENSLYASINNVGASTIGSVSSKVALEAFRISHQNMKIDPRGYLTIPKRLLAWHPNLPTGVKDTVVLVNPSQPTSVVAFALCSKDYTKKVNAYIRKESITLETGPMNSVDTSACSSTEATMLRMLRSNRRNNVDNTFVDDNQFQPATRFSCKSYYAMQFHALRRLYYGGDRNYVESLCNCEQWNAAGGKSGAGFLKTRDQRFIAKAIPEIEVQMFLSMANEYFSYMAKTFEDNLSSMLSKVLGIYKVTSSSETDQKMCMLVMENLNYGREVNFSFDLKGKLEGRYRDRANSNTKSADNGPVLWDRNFIEMAGGIPLPLQESSMSLLLSAIANDTTFLASVQATDYSMLVGYDVKKQEVVASIIDYIHKYDFMKMVEHAGKRLIQDEGEITVLNPRQYRKRFCVAMTKYFVTIPSRYTKVTTMVRSLPESTSIDQSDETGGSDSSQAASGGSVRRIARSRSDNSTLLGLTAAFHHVPHHVELSPPTSSKHYVNNINSVGSNTSTLSGTSRMGD